MCQNKGIYDGKCNRSICDSIGARWYNHSTRAYYCRECAEILNRANRADALRLFGHDLCIQHTPEQVVKNVLKLFEHTPTPPPFEEYKEVDWATMKKEIVEDVLGKINWHGLSTRSVVQTTLNIISEDYKLFKKV